MPPTAVDASRLARAEARLRSAKQALDTAAEDARVQAEHYDLVQGEIDELVQRKSGPEKRIRQIAGYLPPSPPSVKALEDRVAKQDETLEKLKRDQVAAEFEFSKIFDHFPVSVEGKADAIRERFARRISEFLVEKALA